MADLIEAEDGLPAEAVGQWAKDKHSLLGNYLDLASGTRKKFLTGNAKSATYVDLFCGTGRALIRDTNEWVDGSAIVAWKKSKEAGSPFSEVYISDRDPVRLNAAAERLTRLGAPVRKIPGPANQAADAYKNRVNPYGYHFAFIDPYSLGAMNFEIVETLSKLKRMDMLIHISKMDHQRNLKSNILSDASALDSFAPGWRDNVDCNRPEKEIRRQLLDYWIKSVSETGIEAAKADEWELIKGSQGQHLYWLLLAARNDLAHKFWSIVRRKDQGELF